MVVQTLDAADASDANAPSASIACIACSAYFAAMPTLTIRKLDDEVKARLRIRAAQHGRSMEEEARLILRESLNAVAPAEPVRHWVDEVQALFAPHGGLPELQPLPFDAPRNPFAKPGRRRPRKRAGR